MRRQHVFEVPVAAIDYATFVIGLALGGTLVWLASRARRHVRKPAQEGPAAQDGRELFTLASRLEPRFDQSAHPTDLLGDPDFTRAVALLTPPSISLRQVVDYALGANWIIASVALEALRAREDRAGCFTAVRAHLKNLGAWPLYFALRYLASCEGESVIGPAIAAAREWWQENPIMRQIVSQAVRDRLDAGETPSFGDLLSEMSGEQLALVEQFLENVRQPGLEPLDSELAAQRERIVDRGFLESVGRLRSGAEDNRLLIEDERSLRHVAELRSHFERDLPSSVLLVGEAGVGKSAIRELFAGWLAGEGWLVLELTAANLIAGKKYIGEIEEQIRRLLHNARASRRVALFIDRFHELATAGSHRFSPESVLDYMLPALEKRELFVVGETGVRSYQQLLKARPGLRSALEALVVQPASDAETVQLAEQLIQGLDPQVDPGAARRLAAEALQLAAHYVSFRQAPGNALDLIKLTIARQLSARGGSLSLSRADLLATLAQLTGLPESVLDERRRLDIDDIQHRFQQHVIGQHEAISCLVERVAMIKAGLTDPSRPFGVFLFAGPTGTGKTEIAKTLARILFGSPERMIRLDMSEYQTREAMDRLLGSRQDVAGARSLADLVREQPFSVVLLDEFEKAHPNVWDVFLQVFDDGRLTDALGNVADLRHSIIIMTSNAGATVSRQPGIGFTSAGAYFSGDDVRKAISKTFRKEFLNRVDRMVVFEPLSRSQMRQILYKELKDVLARRGFRNREWAVEWEDSAVDFLLERGFTPDLGARPLRRAVDQYVLAPLSMTIVREQFPEGDQFLFVRSDGEAIQVDFVDPDLEVAPSAEPPGPGGGVQSLTHIMLEPRASAAEHAFLRQRFEQLAAEVTGADWVDEKQQALTRIGEEDFWDAPDRYSVLGRAELMDRIEAATRSLGSLVERLSSASPTSRLAAEVAQKLYLMETAREDLRHGRPLHAFVAVTSIEDRAAEVPDAMEFFRTLCDMYAAWAKRRRMKLAVLRRHEAVTGPLELYAAVTGFGAHTILRAESGLHVLEVPADDGKFARHPLRVVVVPQPEAPAPDRARLLAQAMQAVARASEDARDIVRRYRKLPSPLVRDTVRQWRTGRLDRVLEGNFDVVH